MAPARKRAQGQQRRLRKYVARMQALPPLTDEEVDAQRELERSVAEQLGPDHGGGVAGLASDMEALRALQARIRAALPPALTAPPARSSSSRTRSTGA